MQTLQNFQCLIGEEYVKVQQTPRDLVVSSKRRQISKEIIIQHQEDGSSKLNDKISIPDFSNESPWLL
jgi:hypothetical protein